MHPMSIGRPCWIDLASRDEEAAKAFYGRLFGWAAQDRQVGAGRFSTFADGDGPFASLYRLTGRQIGGGVPSHWTPYVAVEASGSGPQTPLENSYA